VAEGLQGREAGEAGWRNGFCGLPSPQAFHHIQPAQTTSRKATPH